MALVIAILATARRTEDFERLIFPHYYNDIIVFALHNVVPICVVIW